MAKNVTHQELIQMACNYEKEADTAKLNRMQQNKINFDSYHLRRSSKEKQAGQSDEFLPKMSMAVEQGANFIQQGLTDLGEWFRVEEEEGLNSDLLQVKPDEVRKLLQRQLEQMKFYNLIGDAAKLGFLGSLIIFKVTGKLVPKAEYVARDVLKGGKKKRQLIKREDKVWQLDIQLVRQEDYYPDPTGRKMYELQTSYIDGYDLLKLSEGKNSPYDSSVVAKVLASNSAADSADSHERSRESGQNISQSGYRNVVKLTEVWGNFVNAKGELTHENCVMTIANDQFVIREPEENPFWHKKSPYVAIPLLSVPHSVWHKALMDAPALLNNATNEMFNLMLDGGMMAVHGIKQIREDYLDDPGQVTDGISPGTTLRANSSTPPGQKVLERIDTATVPQDGFNMLNILNQEFNSSALTSDLRAGAQSFRAVKATEVVEQSQALTSMFTGMVKNLETGLNEVLSKSWMTQAQHMNDISKPALRALLGSKRQAVLEAIPREDFFAETVNGMRFKTFGISATLNKQKDFTKLQALLQTVAGSEVLMESFIRGGNDFGKLLDEIMRSLDINTDRLKSDDGKDAGKEAKEPAEPLAAVQGEADLQSQIPQAGAAVNQGDLTPEGAIPETSFPGSPATTEQGG